MKLNLSKSAWKVRGFRPAYWFERKRVDYVGNFEPDIPPVRAIVPGSVQMALRKAGKLPDWNMGANSLLCQWAEHFQWEFFTDLPSIRIKRGERITLCCDGLDYSGWIGIDGKVAAEFRGALRRHRFDLTEQLRDGKRHQLSVLFDLPPEEQGQAGRTSQSRYFKPRYNYSWDWTPRFVPIGIWGDLWIEAGALRPRVKKVLSELGDDLKFGAVDVLMEIPGAPVKVALSLRDGKKPIGSKTVVLRRGDQKLRLEGLVVDPWFPNGHGKQHLYDLVVKADGKEIDRRAIGFKKVRWKAVEGAPAGAEPMLCEINGTPIFLQGVDWTPIRMDYHDVPAAEYRRRIDLYKKMGCNVLRVWGGAFLEREIFYDLCDQAGLLVWQEFPLSSSTMDCMPPHDPETIDELAKIAVDYIHRRGHHACKLLWCGGNELQTFPNETGQCYPVDGNDPCLARLKQVVKREDPGTRFLPTSPTGKLFYAHAENFGKQLHNHVHGPWNHVGSWAEAVDYWSRDDAGFRSESGMPAAQSLKIMKKYASDLPVWPPTKDNPYWSHTTLWWLPRGQFDKELKGLKGETALARFIEISQELQSNILALAASSCKSRFPACGGFIIWMGHDCFPCPINTSVIDFEGHPKPAYYAIQRIFRARQTPVERSASRRG